MLRDASPVSRLFIYRSVGMTANKNITQYPVLANTQQYQYHSTPIILLLQELVEDVAVATSSRHADLSWARRFAIASPRFIGRRSASTVLSQDCLGQPALHLQSPGESIMQASRAQWWSCQGSARWKKYFYKIFYSEKIGQFNKITENNASSCAKLQYRH